MAKKNQNHHPKFDRLILLFQGGGALGAYQVGVYKGLCENGYTPDWIIATSIGAINSAIIAGNKPEDRVKKLINFWQTISTRMPNAPITVNNILVERWYHFISALCTLTYGQPDFFKPRWWNPWLSVQSTTDQISFYDTEDLRKTLLRFINFDLINEQKIRLSIAAVHVETGRLVYFDNTKMEIKPEHVMACGALPPGFPAVEMHGHYFWDGGIHSNTQINQLFIDDRPIRSLCFMVHLFDSYGTRPTTMDDVLKRLKDIGYSSHHRQFIQTYRNLHNLRHAIRVLSNNLSEEKKKDPNLQKLISLGRTGIIHIVRFHCKASPTDLSSKDYDFSLPSIMEHIDSGYENVCRTLLAPPWYKPAPKDAGLVVYEVSDSPVVEENPLD